MRLMTAGVFLLAGLVLAGACLGAAQLVELAAQVLRIHP